MTWWHVLVGVGMCSVLGVTLFCCFVRAQVADAAEERTLAKLEGR